jgi:hypothetical protein
MASSWHLWFALDAVSLTHGFIEGPSLTQNSANTLVFTQARRDSRLGSRDRGQSHPSLKA